MRIALRITVVAALVGALLAPGTSVASRGCSSQWVEHYDVSLEAAKKAYRLGDKAHITATVTDSLTGLPIEGVTVYFSVIVGYRTIPAASKTDASGVAESEPALERGVLVPGWATLRALAFTYYDEGEAACAGLAFYGQAREERAFRIRR